MNWKALVMIMVMFVMVESEVECSKKVEIVAHRGASYIAPENTLAAYNLAWEMKSDAVEIDVYLTADKQIVVSHDSDTFRTTGTRMNIPKSALEDLRQLDAGKWKGSDYTGEKLPTLEEVLKTIPKGKRILMEIKCGPEIIPVFLVELKRLRKSDRQVAVISFNIEVIKAIKLARPRMQAYWLTVPTAENADTVITTAKSVKADGLDLAATDALNFEYVRKIRDARLKLHVWTVDDTAVGKRLAELGVDGITTNKPDVMLKALRDLK